MNLEYSALSHRLGDLGVPITSIRGHVVNVEAVSRSVARDHPLQLHLAVRTPETLTQAAAPCRHLGNQLDALTLVFDPQEMDATVVAHAVQSLPSVCSSLRIFELSTVNAEIPWSKLQHAVVARPVLRSTSIKSFTMGITKDTRLTKQLIVHPANWLPSLKALRLLGGTYVRNAVDDGCVVLVFQSFPRLQAFDLARVGIQSWNCFLDAYRHRDCRIRSLSINGDYLGVIPLLTALADPAQRVAQMLEELKLPLVPHGDEDQVLAATKAMLETNCVLTYIDICTDRPIRSDAVFDRIRHEVVLKPEAGAFVSVARKHRLVFDFARGMRRRFVKFTGLVDQ